MKTFTHTILNIKGNSNTEYPGCQNASSFTSTYISQLGLKKGPPALLLKGPPALLLKGPPALLLKGPPALLLDSYLLLLFAPTTLI